MVLGCVDVLGKGELLNRKHAFKRELPGRAGIAYWIVENRTRPDTALLREKFLNFVPHTDQRRRKRTRPETSLAQRLRFTRMGNSASELTRAGISVERLKSSLQLWSLTQGLQARFSNAPAKKTSPVYLTGDSVA